MQQRIDVEALLEHGHAVVAAIGRHAERAHPAQERVFIAEEPHAEGLTGKVFRAGHAGFLEAGQHHARALVGLGDVDHRRALLARGERRGHPVDHHVGAAAHQHLHRRHVRPARLDRDVQVFLIVEALVERHVVAGKLRLRHPFELERHVVGGDGAARHEAQRGGGSCQFLHHFSFSQLVAFLV